MHAIQINKNKKMKLKLLLFFFITITSWLAKAQPAVDFTAPDCLGNMHHLFAELNAGKVVIISFVDPCSACVAPTLTAFATAQSYSASFPGRIKSYVADDFANTDCATLNTWTASIGISHSTNFSDTNVSQGDYGPGGMPKIVVFAGTNHTVFFNQNGSIDSTAFYTALGQALAATGINEISETPIKMDVHYQSITNQVVVNYVSAINLKLELYNMVGTLLKTTDIKPESNEARIEGFDLKSGIYFVKLSSNNMEVKKKFLVIR